MRLLFSINNLLTFLVLQKERFLQKKKIDLVNFFYFIRFDVNENKKSPTQTSVLIEYLSN
jgi:hypothetical protein